MAEAREGISGEAAAESSPVIGEFQRDGVCQHRRAGQRILPGEREGDRGEGCGREPGGCEAEDKCVIERGAGVMSEAFILPGRGEKQPEKGWRWLWQSSFGRGIQRFFAVQSRSDEQGRDASRVYIQQHPSEAGLYSFAELLKEGRLLTSEELAQIESRCRGVAKTLLWHDGVPLDDLSDMGLLCVWDVPRLMGMVRELSRVKHDAQGGMP